MLNESVMTKNESTRTNPPPKKNESVTKYTGGCVYLVPDSIFLMTDSYLLMTDSYMSRGGLVEIAESADMINESAIAKNECTFFFNESATTRNESVRKYVPDSFFWCRIRVV
jgi:hypothetical protein